MADVRFKLLKFGRLTSGSARNAISGISHLEGSIRCYSQRDFERIRDIVKLRAEKTDAMRAEERRRRMARGACAGICAGCAAMVARYLANPAHFASRELEPVIGRMLWHIAPWIFVGFACAILCECVRGRSFRREIELAARSPERASFKNAQTDSGASREKRARLAKTAARAAMFALAVALLALGAANGGMRDVLVKAINICTECIGLG